MKRRQILVVDDPFGFNPNLAETDTSDKDLRNDGLVHRKPLHRPYESHGGREYAREVIQPRDEQ